MSPSILTSIVKLSTSSEKTTTNFIDKNFKALQELLSSKNTLLPKDRVVTQFTYPTTIPTFTNSPTTLVYTTTESPVTTTSSSATVQKMKIQDPTKISTQSIRYTTVSYAPISNVIKTTTNPPRQKSSVTQAIKRTTVGLKPVSSTKTNTLENLTTTLKQDISTSVPQLSTHRFMPIKIPSSVFFSTTVAPSTSKQKSAPLSDAEDVEFLVTIIIYFWLNFFLYLNFQQQLANFINRSPSTLSPRGFYSTVTTKAMPTTLKVKTTRIPTFSDADDVKFLNSLVST